MSLLFQKQRDGFSHISAPKDTADTRSERFCDSGIARDTIPHL